MKKAFLYFILILTSVKGFATTYYIDPLGSDSNNGTSPSTAWQTLTKVNSTSFSPGDNILFIKGGVWYGNFTINQNGSSGSPITWGSYGTGANPLISGFITTSGWTNAGSGIWTYTNSVLGSTIPAIITINGSVQPLGRFPKTDDEYTSHNGTTSITDATFSGPSFVGAEVVIRKNHWTNTIGTVTAQSSGTITYSSTSTATPTDGFTFFFQNNINCLTQFGDWFYNPLTNTISMYFGSALPSSYTIKVSSPITLIYINSKSYNTINGINFEGANYAIQGSLNSSNTVISNCNINKIGNNAIDFILSHNLTINNDTVNDVNNTAIALRSTIYDCTISSNTINRVGIIPGAGESDYGLNTEGANCGISVSNAASYSNTIQYNSLKSIGYNGIQTGGDLWVVDSNYIDSACSILDDGGGIYTYTGTPAVVYKGRSITNNIVVNSVGNVPPGLFGPPAGLYQTNEAHGIYLDENSSNLIISNNTVANCGGSGFFFNDPHQITFNNNLSYNNAGAQVELDFLTAFLGVNKGISINYNTIIADSAQYCIKIMSTATGSSIADFTELGTAANNHYGSLSKNINVFETALTEATPIPINLTAWQSLSLLDAQSTFAAPTYTSKRFDYNATIQTTTIALGETYVNIQNNPYTSLVLNPYSSNVLIYTGLPCTIATPVIQSQ